MAERVIARACSLDAGPGVFRIVLTVDIAGVPYQVEFTEQGERADRYASELQRQTRLGLERDNRALKEAHAAAVDARILVEADLASMRQERDDIREKLERLEDEKEAEQAAKKGGPG